MGKADRVIWSSVAAGAAALILNGRLKGMPAVALGGLATLFLLTSSVGFTNQFGRALSCLCGYWLKHLNRRGIN